MTVHVATPPPLDAEAVPAPILARSVLPQEWETLVSPGHVLRARLDERSKPRLVKGWLAAGAFLLVALMGPSIVQIRVPFGALAAFLQSNPDTYVTMPDGTAASYRMKWIADLPVQAGMSGKAWSDLLAAVRSDVAKHGPDVKAWEDVAAIQPAPRITRPNKVFEAAAMDRLATGNVAVAEGAGVVDVIGYVDGVLSWAIVGRGGRCAVLKGVAVEGCTEKPEGMTFEQRIQGFRPGSSPSATLAGQE
ncbi:hypothetical protein [Aureimonas psammosilenae]|uniref:hypothetical protein n=1 Tax=Aureimonas psammosilenae TaxID=2495496 RepID=UPI001260D30E|nr:hypothetical protein [Aureimonas psammosilenae]